MEYKQYRRGSSRRRLPSSELLLHEASVTTATKNVSAGTKIITLEVGAAM